MMYRCVVTLVLGWCVFAVADCTEDQCLDCNSLSYCQELFDSGLVGYHYSSCFDDFGGMKCLPGLFCNETTMSCKCAHYPYPYNVIKCDEEKGTSKVLDCNCATIDVNKNVTLVGQCYYTCLLGGGLYHSLMNSTTLNDSVCFSFRRTGALCGRCLPEHYPLAYSYDMTCIANCSHLGWNWGRYIMAAYLPLTLFCFFILFFEINAVTSHLQPVIWCSQSFSVPTMSRVIFISIRNQPRIHQHILKILLSLYGIWNFDFFRPFYSDICLGIDLLPTLALDYAIAVYPLLLMAITYLLVNLYDKNYRVIVIMWKPFQFIFSLFKKNLDVRTSMIDSCVTFFYLSSARFLDIAFDLLVPIPVYELHPDGYNSTFRLYYSGDIEYFGKEHFPYAILAIITSTVFIILPLTVLTLYPFGFFQKFLNLIPVHWHILHTFVDCFQGIYKDGTEPGTRDCRWFAALLFFVRILVFITSYCCIPEIQYDWLFSYGYLFVSPSFADSQCTTFQNSICSLL